MSFPLMQANTEGRPVVRVLRLDEFDGNVADMVNAIPPDAERVLLIGVSQFMVRWHLALNSGQVTDDPLPSYPETGASAAHMEAYAAACDARAAQRARVEQGLVQINDAHISCVHSPFTAFGVLAQLSSRTTGFVDFSTDVSFIQGMYGNICNSDQWQATCLWLLAKCSRLCNQATADTFAELEERASDLADVYTSHPRYGRYYTAEDLAAEIRTPMLHRIMIAAIVEAVTRYRANGFTLDQIPVIVHKYYTSPTAVRLALNMSRATTHEFASIGGPGSFIIHSAGTKVMAVA